MSKVIATDLKPKDFVDIDAPAIRGWCNAAKLSGMISTIQDYSISGVMHKWVTLVTEKGFQAAYLPLTQEVTKQVMSEKELETRVIKTNMRFLPRTIHGQGSDPEMFVVNKDGIVIPSFDFLPSHKQVTVNQPFWDGFQAEFNIPGVSCLDQTIGHLQAGLFNLYRAAIKHNKDAALTIKPTLEIPPHMLTEGKDEHVQFGCMPSKNVYGMKGIQADGKDVLVRSAGGHIHLQLDNKQKKKIEDYVIALDAILGVACVSMFGNIDDPIRRQYYGLAGEYRTPKHGMEYRTLSNAWMCHPTIAYVVFELARKVCTLVDKDLFKHWQFDKDEVISCINECNIPLSLAEEILSAKEAELDLMWDKIQELKHTDKFAAQVLGLDF